MFIQFTWIDIAFKQKHTNFSGQNSIYTTKLPVITLVTPETESATTGHPWAQKPTPGAHNINSY